MALGDIVISSRLAYLRVVASSSTLAAEGGEEGGKQ